MVMLWTTYARRYFSVLFLNDNSFKSSLPLDTKTTALLDIVYAECVCPPLVLSVPAVLAIIIIN